jgi:hypothetical protein
VIPVSEVLYANDASIKLENVNEETHRRNCKITKNK